MPYDPEELQAKVERGELQDGPQTLAMVEYIGEFPISDPPHEQAFDQIPEELKELKELKGHYYRCTNLDEDGLCSIYEDRPRMCSAFPYGGACNYRGCKASFAARSDTPVEKLQG